jgi:hypothetical protein
MSSTISQLERQGYPIRKVDVDQESDLARKYQIESIPCFVLVVNGKAEDRISGITTREQLVRMMNRLPKSDARNQPDLKRQGKPTGPHLGTPIPVTPPITEAPPQDPRLPRFTPEEPRDLEIEPTPPANDGARGQTPEIDPMRSSVRIRVKDGSAINYGSGTIIESTPGHATILSCGHIFRNLSRNAVIEIDLYSPSRTAKPTTVMGRVMLTDMEADLGLVSINHATTLHSMPLGPSRPLAIGEHLFSIGCSGGDNPTRENVDLTAMNKYKGPENLECTSRPAKGRSGGGLFRDEELVGVCIAADPKAPLGLYTGLQPINLLLEKAGLEHLVYKPNRNAPIHLAQPGEEKPKSTPEPRHLKSADEEINRILSRELEGGGDPADVDFAGAEVVCIIRSKTPGKPSRIVIVNQASGRFVADLLHESTSDPDRLTADKSRPQPSGPIETSFEPQPYRRQKTK